MGQVRHGSATTTFAVRAAIQRSQASLAQLSRELGINPKTVAKWRKRATVEDMKTGPSAPRSRRLDGSWVLLLTHTRPGVGSWPFERCAPDRAPAPRHPL